MKAATVVIIVIAFILGHEYGVSNVAKECRLSGGFVNGKLSNGQYELYSCQPLFDPALKKADK